MSDGVQGFVDRFLDWVRPSRSEKGAGGVSNGGGKNKPVDISKFAQSVLEGLGDIHEDSKSVREDFKNMPSWKKKVSKRVPFATEEGYKVFQAQKEEKKALKSLEVFVKETKKDFDDVSWIPFLDKHFSLRLDGVDLGKLAQSFTKASQNLEEVRKSVQSYIEESEYKKEEVPASLNKVLQRLESCDKKKTKAKSALKNFFEEKYPDEASRVNKIIYKKTQELSGLISGRIPDSEGNVSKECLSDRIRNILKLEDNEINREIAKVPGGESFQGIIKEDLRQEFADVLERCLKERVSPEIWNTCIPLILEIKSEKMQDLNASFKNKLKEILLNKDLSGVRLNSPKEVSLFAQEVVGALLKGEEGVRLSQYSQIKDLLIKEVGVVFADLANEKPENKKKILQVEMRVLIELQKQLGPIGEEAPESWALHQLFNEIQTRDIPELSGSTGVPLKWVGVPPPSRLETVEATQAFSEHLRPKDGPGAGTAAHESFKQEKISVEANGLKVEGRNRAKIHLNLKLEGNRFAFDNGSQDYNGDCVQFYTQKGISLGVVTDAAGNKKGSKDAAQGQNEALAEVFFNSLKSQVGENQLCEERHVVQALTDAVIQVDQIYAEKSRSHDPEKKQDAPKACTASLTVVLGEEGSERVAIGLNVGDAKALLRKANGDVRDLTPTSCQAQFSSSGASVGESGGKVYVSGLEKNSFMSAREHLRFYRKPLNKGDQLILGSDGLGDNLEAKTRCKTPLEAFDELSDKRKKEFHSENREENDGWKECTWEGGAANHENVLQLLHRLSVEQALETILENRLEKRINLFLSDILDPEIGDEIIDAIRKELKSLFKLTPLDVYGELKKRECGYEEYIQKTLSDSDKIFVTSILSRLSWDAPVKGDRKELLVELIRVYFKDIMEVSKYDLKKIFSYQGCLDQQRPFLLGHEDNVDALFEACSTSFRIQIGALSTVPPGARGISLKGKVEMVKKVFDSEGLGDQWEKEKKTFTKEDGSTNEKEFDNWLKKNGAKPDDTSLLSIAIT